jgi:hypothetical protein
MNEALIRKIVKGYIRLPVSSLLIRNAEILIKNNGRCCSEFDETIEMCNNCILKECCFHFATEPTYHEDEAIVYACQFFLDIVHQKNIEGKLPF